MKVLITGNCGYIGSHLFRQLMFAPGIELTGCDLKANAPVDFADMKGHEFDVVVHLAAFVSVTESLEKSWDYMFNNAWKTMLFLKNNKIGHIIFASTGGAMYGDRVLAREEDARYDLCLSPYAQSKFVAEQIIREMQPSHTILRLANVYGGNVAIRGEAAVHAHFEQDNPIVVYGGKQTRDFIDVSDVCFAINKAIKTRPVGTFNIGSGVETPIIDLASEFSHQRGVAVELKPARPGEVQHISLDITKAKKAGLL